MRRASAGLVAAFLCALVLAPGLARASTLIGSTAGISVTSAVSLSASPATAVIGSGVEFVVSSAGSTFLRIDIRADSVVYEVGFGNFVFTSALDNTVTLTGLTFTGPDADITGIDPQIGSGISGVTGSSFTWTADSLTLTFDRSSWNAGSTIVVDLTASGGGGGSTDIPEPATLGLLATGVLGLAAFRRRRPGTPAAA